MKASQALEAGPIPVACSTNRVVIFDNSVLFYPFFGSSLKLIATKGQVHKMIFFGKGVFAFLYHHVATHLDVSQMKQDGKFATCPNPQIPKNFGNG